MKLLERVGQEQLDTLDPHDFLILGLITSGKKLPAELHPRLPHLLERGILNRTGPGKLILSKRLYSSTAGVPARTAKRDAARTQKMALLREHITENQSTGRSLQDIMLVFPEFTRNQIQFLLKQLQAEGLVHRIGTTERLSEKSC